MKTKYNYLGYFGWYLFVACAGFGMFILYYSVANLYFSVLVGCFVSAIGSKIIPPLETFEIKNRKKR